MECDQVPAQCPHMYAELAGDAFISAASGQAPQDGPLDVRQL